MQFICVGVDVRILPCGGFYSADSSEWERDEAGYAKLIASGQASQNQFGLLTVKDEGVFDDICEQILDSPTTCDLAVVELPLEVVEFFNAERGYSTTHIPLNLSQFICRGFDICDLNGFITLLNHPLLRSHTDESGLVSKTDIFQALVAAQLANVLAADHRPAVVARVHSLR